MPIDTSNFQHAFDWIIAHGYIFIFLLMCVEGPIITAAAGFAAALGYFNPWVILILAFLGDLVPDTIYYFVGHSVRFGFVEKIGRKFGLTQPRMIRMENLLEKNFKKTMLTLKFTPGISVMGFILVGYLRLSFRKFIGLCTAVTVPKATLFLIIGYYFGHLYNINQYLQDISILLPILGITITVIYFIYKNITRTIRKKTEKI